MTDCVIVGGGLLGLSSALELAAAGCRVKVIERALAARESTWAGGGILSPLYPWRYPPAVSALAAWSQRHYPLFLEKLRANSGIDPEYQASGLLILDSAEHAEAGAWAGRFGQTLEILDAEGARACEPLLGPDSGGALWLPTVGQVRNPRLGQALRQAVLNAGVDILENTPVRSLLREGGRIRGVATDAARLPGDCVILAAGAWSGGLLAELGLACPVRPIRGQMLLFKAAPGLLKRIVLSRNRYLIPRRDGRILAGSTLEDVGFDKSISGQARDDLHQAAVNLAPALGKVPIEHHWAGLRPGSPAGIPYIGAHPELDGLYLNTGHFRNGVVLGLASARLLADAVLGRAPILPLADYAPGRGEAEAAWELA